MNITVFPSDKGDCLLLESADGKLMLADGGLEPAYDAHVAPYLGQLRQQNRELDLVYISHNDQDHIAGVLKLLDDQAAWRIFEYQRRSGNRGAKQPKAARPPEIRRIWHNAFRELVSKNVGDVADMLATARTVMEFGEAQGLKDAGFLAQLAAIQNWAASAAEAIQVSRRISREQLNVPLNPEFGGKLIMVRDKAPSLNVGSIRLRVIGPFAADVEKYRDDWNKWLRKASTATTLKSIAKRSKKDQRYMGQSVTDSLLAAASALGDRKKVTAPNLASVMLIAEEAGKTVLLTGDGHADDILKGLKSAKKLDSSGRIHADVLKVQHHGSEFNVHTKFADAVTADHYIFCGNGEHENPNLDVVKLFADSRLQTGDRRNFKFWFNCSSKNEPAKTKGHMRKVEQLVTKLEGQAGVRLTSIFLDTGVLQLRV